YIPLGGNRLGSRRRYQNLLLTMLLGGLWHGAGWNFLIWGGLHGIYLTINHLWQSLTGGPAKRPPPTPIAAFAGWTTTFAAVVFAWVFFRAVTLGGAWRMTIALLDGKVGSAAYVSPGILQVMDLPIPVGPDHLFWLGLASVGCALAIALV